MAQRKICASWWVDITYRGVRYRRRSPDNTKPGAQAFEATLRRRLAEGDSSLGDRKTDKHQQLFKDFAHFWFKTHVKVHNKPSMVAKSKGILLRKLIPAFGDTPLNKLSTLQIEEYKARASEQSLANKTINNELSILSKCLNDARRWLKLESLPDIVMLKVPPSSYDYLNEEESRELLRYLSGMWFEITYVALRTGLRRGELQGLRWSDINLTNSSLTVRHSWCAVERALLSPKSNKVRTVPLSPDVIELLNRKPAKEGFVFPHHDSVFQPATLGQALSTACRRAKLRHVTPHTLRHSYASQLAMKGTPIAVIQRLLGHSDIKVTMRYAHLSQDSLNDVVKHMQTPLSEDLAEQAA